MLESIISEIDAEIARLTAARVLLNGEGKAVVKRRRPGRPVKTKSIAISSTNAAKRRTMSVEARDRIRQAQIKRWAAVRKPGAANLNATIAPISKVRKKAAKTKT